MAHKFNVFISYSSQDKEFAEQLARSLESEGMKVWSDRDIQPGASLTEEIVQGIEQSQHAIVVVSPNSLNSPLANFEIGVALSKISRSPEMLVVPVLTQDVDVSSLPFSTKNRVLVDAATTNVGELGSKISQIFADSRTAHSQKN
jgi:TIR domain